jgi:SHS2 domain-containing protein
LSDRWVEYTGKLEVEIKAPTREAVFAEAPHAPAEILGEDGHSNRMSREVIVDSRERAGLLAERLNELAYLAETEDLVPDELGQIQLSKRRLAATMHFGPGRPRQAVKGETYHRLSLVHAGRGFRATVVLDV